MLIKTTLSRTHVCWMNQYVQAVKEEPSRRSASLGRQMEQGPGTPPTAWHLLASLREGTRFLGQSLNQLSSGKRDALRFTGTEKKNTIFPHSVFV